MKNRTKNVVVTLIVGLILNISLGVAKLVVGLMSRSSSVTSDALNNLSDVAVSLVTIIATALAARAADHDHPFGHGRYEYISTFVLGAVIMAVGIEVFVSGVERAIEPVDVAFGLAVWITLGVSIAVKSFMAVFYTVHGKRNKSDTVKAAGIDAVSDAAVTSVVLACTLIERYVGVHIDGYVSIAVSLVITVCALRILKRTVSRLLGERPDAELYNSVMSILTAEQSVLSVHDLIINDYGEKKIAEADAVFAADMSFVDVHAVCDRLERSVTEQTGIRLCLHADPLIVDDARLEEIRERLDGLLSAFAATAHDIFIDDDNAKVVLDITLPDDKAPSAAIIAQVEAQVRSVLPYSVEVCIDYI